MGRWINGFVFSKMLQRLINSRGMRKLDADWIEAWLIDGMIGGSVG